MRVAIASRVQVDQLGDILHRDRIAKGNPVRHFCGNVERAAQRGSTFLVATDDSGILGYCLISRGEVFDIDILEVFESHRQRGTARRLVHHARRLAIREDSLAVRVECEPRESLPFWEHMGFRNNYPFNAEYQTLFLPLPKSRKAPHKEKEMLNLSLSIYWRSHARSANDEPDSQSRHYEVPCWRVGGEVVLSRDIVDVADCDCRLFIRIDTKSEIATLYKGDARDAIRPIVDRWMPVFRIRSVPWPAELDACDENESMDGERCDQ